MRLPSIHLNGTDAQSLFDGYRAAYEAVKAAQKALAQCAPNGRDYYGQDSMIPGSRSAINDAMDEHRARMAALETIERDLEAFALHLMEFGGDKLRT
jgi:hypothetical protein